MNTKEIHKLRIKFIAVSMAAFSLVIFVIGALINVVNYTVTQREINYSLEEILDKKDAIDEMDHSAEELPDAPSLAEAFSPVYQRNVFYIVSYSGSGDEISFHASRGNIYPEEIIRELAQDILQSPSRQGRDGAYYYLTIQEENGEMTVVMMDCRFVAFSRIRLLYASIFVGVGGFLVTLLLVIFLSGKMIQPEIEANQKQLQFLTNVSHELKTPLAVIRSNAEMEEYTQGENEWTQSTIRQVDRMSGLIKSLVMITRSRETSDSQHSSQTKLSAVLSETVSEFSAMAEGEYKNIEKDIAPDLTVKGDESKIRQLVMILIDNAVKYCDTNGTIIISLSAVRHGKRSIRLTVTNTYKDGNSADCKRFFDRFYREDDSHNIDTGGYGIGLSIAESICDQLNGVISAEWRDGIMYFICELI